MTPSPVLNASGCVWERSSTVREADLELGESLEDAAHEEGAHGGGGLGGHPCENRWTFMTAWLNAV